MVCGYTCWSKDGDRSKMLIKENSVHRKLDDGIQRKLEIKWHWLDTMIIQRLSLVTDPVIQIHSAL